MNINKRKEICNRWNNETKTIREFILWYKEKLKKEYDISDKEWESLKYDQDTGKIK